MYFEHSRSGGGPVQSIEIDRNEDYAIVCFEQYGGKTIHKLNGQQHRLVSTQILKHMSENMSIFYKTSL